MGRLPWWFPRTRHFMVAAGCVWAVCSLWMLASGWAWE